MAALLVLQGCSDNKRDPAIAAARQAMTSASSPDQILKTTEGLEYVAGQVLVRFKDGGAKDAALAKVSGAEVIHSYQSLPNLHVVALAESVSVDEAITAFLKDPNVLYAEHNWVVHINATTQALPNDARFGELWGMNNTGQSAGTADADINAPEAWELTTGSATAGVVVVIDTGIDYNHQDLAANVFANPGEIPGNNIDDDNDGYIDDVYGVNAITNTGNPLDDHDHGSHCSGTIAGAGNNGIGVAGVNWTGRVMGCKFLSAAGSGSIADAVKCLDWVHLIKSRTANRINVITTSNSWGGGGFSQPFLDGLGVQLTDGTLFIAAAGNSSADNDATAAYPNGYFLPNVIAVAATDRNDAKASFSSYGRRTVHVGAPGVDVLSSTRSNTYQVFSGTSMATPHVAGLAALLKAQDPSRDWKAIKNLILTGGQVKASMANTLTGKRIRAADTGGVGSLTCNNQLLQTRVRPIASAAGGGIGQPVDIMAYNVNCGASAGNMTVTFTGPDSGSVILADNGVAPDQVAGDGMVGGQFIPNDAGTYTLTFPGGDTFTVSVTRLYLPAIPTPFSYRTITGTNLALTDDSFGTITSPFPIQYAGNTTGYTTVRASMNGLVTFGTTSPSFTNTALPNSAHQTILAAFWDDLYPGPTAADNVYWQVIGTAPNRELVIEWRNVYHRSVRTGLPIEPITFQVVLTENSPIVIVNYKDVITGNATYDKGASATVGTQVSSTGATQFSFNTASLSDNTAYLWTFGNRPALAPTDVLAVSPLNGQEGDATTITLSGFSDPDGAGDAPFTLEVDLSYDGVSFNPEVTMAVDTIGPITFNTAFNQNGADLRVAARIKDKVGLRSNAIESTDHLNVIDVPPSLAPITAPATINEGQATPFAVSFADPGADMPWHVEIDYDYDGTTFTSDETRDVNTTAPLTIPHNYRLDGAYKVAIKVTDKDGVVSNLQTLDVNVNDLKPGVATVTGPATLLEGLSMTLDTSFTNPGDNASPWHIEWDLDYDGTTFTADASEDKTAEGPLTLTRDYLDSGAHVIALRITDSDGSVSDLKTFDLNVDEVNPIITRPSFSPATGNEGRSVIFSLAAASGSPNALADPIAYYLWDFDGDGTFDQLTTYPTALFRYRDNKADGSAYTAKVRVVDEDSYTDHDYTVEVVNAAPTVASIANANRNEGEEFSYRVSASDPGGDSDPLSYQLTTKPAGMTISANGFIVWTPTAAQATTAGMDHPVVVRVTDDDGASSEVSFTVKAMNVAPTLAALPATVSAGPSAPLALQAAATDPGGSSALTFSLGGAPTGMSVSTSGLISWSPGRKDAFLSGGRYPITVTVTDDDGETASGSTTIVVALIDTDSDGMDDEWELAHGLDPADGSDAIGDRDSDGISNLHEYYNAVAGPFTPGLVTLDAPAVGGAVHENDVKLTVNNTTDADSSTISYVFEVYADEARSAAALGTASVSEGPDGKTSVLFDNLQKKDGSSDDDTSNTNDIRLTDNTWYWWRARATDGDHPGAWSGMQKFFFDPVNDLPTKPGIASPLVGDYVSVRTPTLIIGNSSDQDDANVTYSFEVFRDEALATKVAFTATPLAAGSSGSTSWTILTPLTAHTTYWWRVTASDGRGGTTASETGRFTVFVGNAEPGVPSLKAPANGAVIGASTVMLQVNNAVDPDGDVLSYYFELDTSPTFNSADRIASPAVPMGDNVTSWSATGLKEDKQYYWRARALDAYASGEWFTAAFMVNATNGKPSTPIALTPSDGAIIGSAMPTLAVLNATDPEGDALTYEFEVHAEKPDGAVAASSTGVTAGSAQTALTLTAALQNGKSYYWTARAIDSHGEAGDWTAPAFFRVNAGGCGCGAFGTQGDAFMGGMLPLLAVALGLSLIRRKK